MTNDKLRVQCIAAELGDVTAYTFPMKVKDVVNLHYVAVRGQDKEEGSVQRPLSKRRIEGIVEYIIAGNNFFNSFILNWTDKKNKISILNNKIELPLVSSAAQAIDGQHRLAGLQDAMEVEKEVGERIVIVTLCNGLTTSQAAKIFLNINTEQKPVPKSLLFDLFGETDSDPEHAINRARDIALALHGEGDSPLYNLIKLPGAPRGAGRIELSTFVTALKKGLEQDGELAKFNLKTFEHQKHAVRNYFQAIKESYTEAKLWGNISQNPFLKAAGFNGAIDFFIDKLILKCAEKKSFSVVSIKEILALDSRDLLTWDDLKGQDGKSSKKFVSQFLARGLTNSIKTADSYEF